MAASLRSAQATPRRLRRLAAPERTGGFTLIELLTVMAIVAVLATLLLTALGAAKKKSGEALCTGNLRQVCLALTMYLDDFDDRPTDFGALTRARYLTGSGVLLCPRDRTGNWGALVGGSAAVPEFGFNVARAEGASLGGAVGFPPYSYLHPLEWDESEWVHLMREDMQAGLVACQLHGLGRPNLEAPSVRDYEGLVLRGQKDGAIVRRKVYWADLPKAGPPSFAAGAPEAAMPDRAPTDTMFEAEDDSWRFFSDEPRR